MKIVKIHPGDFQGKDLSKYLKWSYSEELQPIFEIKKHGSEFRYKVFSKGYQFVIEKIRTVTKKNAKGEILLEEDHPVNFSQFGDKNNRGFCFYMFTLEGNI